MITDPVVRVLRPLYLAAIWTGSRLLRPDWRGVHRLPARGGMILAVNHISNVDPLVMAVFVAQTGGFPQFLAKASLFEIPLFGRLLRGMGQIPVHRGAVSAADALEPAVAAIAAGGRVLIYPEGTITDDPQLWPMRGKTGAARLALRTGCPVVPLGQWGAQRVMYGKHIGRPRIWPLKRMSVLVGDPVPLDDLRAQPETPEVVREATTRIMAAITAQVAELRGQAPPPVAYDQPR